jgi:hypothetical protein
MELQMDNLKFKIIFDKLSDEAPAGAQPNRELIQIREISVQADEIAELSGLVAEVSDPEPQLYTTT